MSDDALSKRERQKQRRSVKVEEQRKQEAAARRRRLGLLGITALVIVGLIGLGVANYIQDKQEQREQLARAKAIEEDMGCTPAADAEQPSAGAGHFETDQELRASPPETVYQDRPASSGKHHSAVVKSGFYDVKVDERLLVHNLEHGYIIAHYDEGASDDEIAQLEETVTGHIDGDYPKMIAAPFEGDMPDDKNVSFTAWTFRQTCEKFDPDLLGAFAQAHHSGRGVAPEKTVPAHLVEGNGVLDPKGKDLLLPPLGTAASPTENTTEGSGGSEAAEPTEGSS